MVSRRLYWTRLSGRHRLSIWRALAGAMFLVVAGTSVQGEERLHVIIDRLVALQTPDYEKVAAPICSDEEFVRRIALDLTGMIPTAADARAFLADAETNK